MNSNEFLAGINSLLANVTTAQRSLSAGEAVDLAGFDTQVAALCDKAAGLSAEQRIVLVPLLEQLVQVCDELACNLKQAAQAASS
jgi:hypothetical protein